jgi:hypothetical protein
MSTTNLLSKIRSRADQTAAAHRETYRKLVSDAAEHGDEANADALLAKLNKLGIDPEEFAADVELAVRRMELAKVAAQLPDHNQRVIEAEALLVALTTARIEAIKLADSEFLAKSEPAKETLAKALADVRSASAARDSLIESADEELAAERAEAAKLRSRAAEAIAPARNRLRNAEADVRIQKNKIANAAWNNRPIDPEELPRREERVTLALAAVAAAESAWKESEAALAEADAALIEA